MIHSRRERTPSSLLKSTPKSTSHKAVDSDCGDCNIRCRDIVPPVTAGRVDLLGRYFSLFPATTRFYLSSTLSRQNSFVEPIRPMRSTASWQSTILRLLSDNSTVHLYAFTNLFRVEHCNSPDHCGVRNLPLCPQNV